MGSEATFWNYLRKRMKGRWQVTRVENPAEPGTPDVYFTLPEGVMGWIELKHAHKWPRRASTVVKFDHYTTQQKSWAKRHSDFGANVSLMVQIEKDYFLFRPPHSLEVGEMTKEEMFDKCEVHWQRSVDTEELKKYLKKY